MQINLEELQEIERKQFDFKVEKDRFEEGMVQISTTHNGSAWSSLRVYETELPKIIEALQKFSGLTSVAADAGRASSLPQSGETPCAAKP